MQQLWHVCSYEKSWALFDTLWADRSLNASQVVVLHEKKLMEIATRYGRFTLVPMLMFREDENSVPFTVKYTNLELAYAMGWEHDYVI
jgi:hypothetical protein